MFITYLTQKVKLHLFYLGNHIQRRFQLKNLKKKMTPDLFNKIFWEPDNIVFPNDSSNPDSFINYKALAWNYNYIIK